MRFIPAEEVHRLLPWPSLIAALREAHRGPPPRIGRLVMEEAREGGQPNMLLAIPAWQPGQALGCKLIASFPGNVAEHGLPTVNALYAVFDPATGVPQAVIDGEALIFRKTAADSALGASLLAREDVETMLMIGAGGLAPYLIGAHRAARPSLRRVLIWNRTAERADALAARLRREGVAAEAVPDLQAALPQADLVSSATMAQVPHVLGERLRPGAHVDLVGAFTPAMRESDDEALRRSRIFCDTLDCLDRNGDLAGPLQRGVIGRDAILGDLFSLCAGAPGRRSADEITLYKNGAGGHLDLFVARHLIVQAASAAASPRGSS